MLDSKLNLYKSVNMK